MCNFNKNSQHFQAILKDPMPCVQFPRGSLLSLFNISLPSSPSISGTALCMGSLLIIIQKIKKQDDSLQDWTNALSCYYLSTEFCSALALSSREPPAKDHWREKRE